MEVCFASERGTLLRNFRDIVLILHHQSLAVKWKHPRVHPQKPEGQSITTGKQSLTIFAGMPFKTYSIACAGYLWPQTPAFTGRYAR